MIEVLRPVTQVIVTTTTDRYKLHAPEVMHEPAMSDEEDDGMFTYIIVVVILVILSPSLQTVGCVAKGYNVGLRPANFQCFSVMFYAPRVDDG